MTPNTFCRVAGGGSRQLTNNGKKGRLSSHPLHHYKVICAWESLTLYQPCMCLRGRRPSTMIGTEEVFAKKNQHVVNFQTTETKLVAVHSSPGEDA